MTTTTINLTLQIPPHLADTIAQALTHLAQALPASQEQRGTPLPSPREGGVEAALIPVTEIRAALGRRGRPMAHTTFITNYIHSGRLRLADGPTRKNLWVRKSDWEKLKTEIGK